MCSTYILCFICYKKQLDYYYKYTEERKRKYASSRGSHRERVVNFIT